MSDKPKIIAGVAIFVVLVTFPIWYTLGFEAYSPGSTAAPDRKYDVDKALRCLPLITVCQAQTAE